MQKLSLGFILFIILEMVSLVLVGRCLGIGLTLFAIMLFFVIGLALVQGQIKIWFQFKVVNSLSSRQSLGRSLRFLITGLFFMSPGFFSDLLAMMVLLFPSYLFLRIFPYYRQFAWFGSFIKERKFPFQDPDFSLYKKKTPFNDENIIEGQFDEIDKEN